METKNIIVLSVGGSLIAPEGIDTAFLTEFKKKIEYHIKKGLRFIIIAGGGKTARIYQSAARAVTELTTEDVDWIGIHSTRLNAHLLRAIFHADAYPRIVKNPYEDISFKEPILLAAGFRPGCSTDYDAVLLAKNIGAKTIINLTNIDYVYDKDPKKFPDAVKIERIDWAKFRKIIPDHWDPGLNSPFDPVAARECDATNTDVVILNGKNLDNLSKYLENEPFIGTVISNKE